MTVELTSVKPKADEVQLLKADSLRLTVVERRKHMLAMVNIAHSRVYVHLIIPWLVVNNIFYFTLI